MMLHDRIKMVRTGAGDSQAQLGDKLGVAQRTVAGWESGSREPNAGMLSKIADVYNVSVDFLLGRTDIPAIVEFDDGYKGPIYSNKEAPLPDEVEQGAEGLRHAFRAPQQVIDMRGYDLTSPEAVAIIESIVARMLAQNQEGHDNSTDH